MSEERRMAFVGDEKESAAFEAGVARGAKDGAVHGYEFGFTAGREAGEDLFSTIDAVLKLDGHKIPHGVRVRIADALAAYARTPATPQRKVS